MSTDRPTEKPNDWPRAKSLVADNLRSESRLTTSNPYAAHLTEDDPSSAHTAEPSSNAALEDAPRQGCWRDGNLIVTYRNGHLPHLCPVTGSTEIGQFYQQTFLYHRIWPLNLHSWSAYVARVKIAYSKEVVSREQKDLWIGVLMMFAGAASYVPAVMLAEILPPAAVAVLLAASLILGTIGFAVGVYRLGSAKPIRVARMDDQFVWLKGAGQVFLNALPTWQGVENAIPNNSSLSNSVAAKADEGANPFAEDTQPGELRYVDLNLELLSRDESTPFVLPNLTPGCWRDGDLFVAHRHGQLPRFCVLTGSDQIHQAYVQTICKTANVKLLASFSKKAVTQKNLVGLFTVVSAMLFIGAGYGFMMSFDPHGPIDPDSRLLLFVGCVLGVLSLGSLALAVLMHYRTRLTVVRCEGDYAWIHGASDSFLWQLPVWTGDAAANLDQATAELGSKATAAVRGK